MKIRVLIALLVGGVMSALFGVSATASAAPVAYPQGICSTVSVSTTNPQVGESITVTGANFEPKAAVALVLKRQSTGATTKVKTVTSDAAGAFTTSVTLPGSSTNAGRYDLIATSGYTRGGSCPADPFAALSLGAAGAGAGTGGGGGGNGGTAFTGLDIAALVAAALVLLVGGGAIAYRGRKRATV